MLYRLYRQSCQAVPGVLGLGVPAPIIANCLVKRQELTVGQLVWVREGVREINSANPISGLLLHPDLGHALGFSASGESSLDASSTGDWQGIYKILAAIRTVTWAKCAEARATPSFALARR